MVSVVCYVSGWNVYSDWNEHTGYVVSVLCSNMWLLGSNIAIIIRNVHTGHVVSVVCSVCD